MHLFCDAINQNHVNDELYHDALHPDPKFPADTSFSPSGNLNNVPQICVFDGRLSDSHRLGSRLYIWLCLKSDEDINKQKRSAEVKYLCVLLTSTCQQSAA